MTVVPQSCQKCGFGYIYWRNPYGKLQFLCSVEKPILHNFVNLSEIFCSRFLIELPKPGCIFKVFN